MKKYSPFLLIIPLLIAVAILILWLPTKNNDQERKSEEYLGINEVPVVKEAEEVTFSEDKLKQYYASYQDPFALHLRKALNGYLNGTNEGMNFPKAAIERDDSGDDLSGLESFDKEYYKSKFVILTLDDSVGGGKLIHIIFQDKPDKIFGAWVYPMGNGTYDLRGFWENTKATQNIDVSLKTLGKYIFDKEHSL